jgi:hypothetical protein
MALIFTGPSFLFASWQYRATFQAHQPSAYKIQYVGLIFGAIAFLVPITVIVDFLSSKIKPSSSDIVGFALPPLVVGVALCWNGFLNYRWHKRLANVPVVVTGVDTTDASRTRLKTLQFVPLHVVGNCAAVAIVLLGGYFGLRDIPPHIAEHVSPQEARLILPPGATDVSIRRGSRGVISYNFAIDEPGFWEWTKSAGGSLESERSGVTIKPIAGSFEIYDSFAPDDTHTATHGWFYDFHVEDRGHQYVFDTDEQRVYFYFHAF